MSFIGDIFFGGNEKKAANIQAQSAEKAGAYSLQAAREVIAMHNQQFQQSRADLAPMREAGNRALEKQENLLSTATVPDDKFIASTGPDYSRGAFESSPGYQFLLDEGANAINKRNAATGSFYSGAPMRELARYTAGLASQDYENWFNRTRTAYTDQYERDKGEYTDYFNRLAGIAGTGQTATYNTAQLGANAATNAGSALQSGAGNYAQALIGAGDARASGVIGAGNAQRKTMFDIASLFVSDRRLKKNIELVGSYKEYPLYTFNYIWDQIKRVGVMADEVIKINPDAVTSSGGYMLVDYSRL
jgi:hypothetical protein